MVAHLDTSEQENLCQLIQWNSAYFEKSVVIQTVKNVCCRFRRLRHSVLPDPDNPTSHLVNSYLLISCAILPSLRSVRSLGLAIEFLCDSCFQSCCALRCTLVPSCTCSSCKYYVKSSNFEGNRYVIFLVISSYTLTESYVIYLL